MSPYVIRRSAQVRPAPESGVRLGREFVGIERDPRYFALACERLRAEERGSTVVAARAGQTSIFDRVGT